MMAKRRGQAVAVIGGFQLPLALEFSSQRRRSSAVFVSDAAAGIRPWLELTDGSHESTQGLVYNKLVTFIFPPEPQNHAEITGVLTFITCETSVIPQLLLSL